jgi:hypothetical protein
MHNSSLLILDVSPNFQYQNECHHLKKVENHCPTYFHVLTGVHVPQVGNHCFKGLTPKKSLERERNRRFTILQPPSS